MKTIVWLTTVLCVAARAACPPDGETRESLRSLKAVNWQLDDAPRRTSLAQGLVDCLADPDQELRDDLAFGALQQWMRAGQLDADGVRRIAQRLLPQLSASPEPTGFAAPFAALTLAEVARVDRLKPIFSPNERDALLGAAADYLRNLRDYRGFDARQGWRHGVAHGADLLMQLALNPALDKFQLDRILDAVAHQVVPAAEHFYIYGEGDRLARPVLFVARRGLHSADEWTAWFTAIATAAKPIEGQGPTQGSLARLHDAKAFLWPVYAALQEGQDGALRTRLMPGVTAALRALP
ncbi:MAG TPA: DUF2785 domain-containing protein [Burkholderiaceae bacterium]|jgi:hypothetical protein|nr:DUF2785 domain-containing protein [Burkholderiaceae bacterium]